MTRRRPPKWMERLVDWTVPPGLSGHGTLGDLAEGFQQRAKRSPVRARFWYAGQTASILFYRLLRDRRVETGGARSGLALDLKWALRSMARHPLFFLGVVGVLGLGLGANAAVFSVVDGTLRNVQWWGDPDATVSVWPDRQFSFGHIQLYDDEQQVYRSLGGYGELAFALQAPDGESESVNGVLITPELFRELAVQPVYGRALEDQDAIFGTEPVVIMGEGIWRRSFGADPSILGSRINVSGTPMTVVGIQGSAGMAPGGRTELWLPLVVDPRDDDFWKAQSYRMVGVLAEGSTLDRAFEDLSAYTDRLSQLFPMFYPPGFADGLAYVAWADEAQRRLVATPLWLLLAGTTMLLLVTALNVGNLLLGRAIDRRRELAVRFSLGAGRGRIVRQLVVEGTVLTFLALLIGMALGTFGGRWIATLFVGEVIVTSSSVFSPGVLLFALGVSGLAWLVLNGVPIAHFLNTARRGPTVSPASSAGMQRSLVVVQSALATLLLVSATLLVATVANLRRVPLGFESGGLLTVELSPPQDRVETTSAARNLYGRLVQNVRGLPGVESAGLTGWLPMRVQAPATPINLERAPVNPAQAPSAPLQMVDPGFFESFGVVPVAGRLLGPRDVALEPSAVVVNQTLADLLWPDGSAVGQRIAIDPHAWMSWVTVVGVVPDIRSGDITGPIGPQLYVSLAESPSRDVTLVVKTAGAPEALIPMLRRAVRDVDQLVPIRAISGMTDVVRAAYATSWVMMGLLIVLAALAAVLGAVGVYAVLAHHVALSRREIGLRMALGATPGTVIGGVVRSGIALAGTGIVIGCLAAAMSTRFLESMLYEVSALAPWAFLAPAVTLVVAAALAAWIPAARAGRLPPADVLKCD